MTCRHYVAILLLAALAGCGTPKDSVVFVTKTSLGVDVDSTPPSASIAYDRTEGYFGPRFNDGSAPPVAGSFFTSGGLFNRQIRQLYATGPAAVAVTAGATTVTAPVTSFTGDARPMFFGTRTVLGLQLAFNATGIDALTFGFKRKEASMIPVATTAGSKLPDGTAVSPSWVFPSVLASLDTDFAAKTATDTTVGIHQYFATGTAANHIATYGNVQANFRQDATDSLARYRRDERLQASALLDTLSCLAELPDARLSQVWSNAEDLKLFSDPAVYPALRAQVPAQARATYTRYVTIIDADSSMHTGLLVGHRSYVCNLRS